MVGPTLVICGYAIYTADIIGMFVAYCALLAMAVWELSRSYQHHKDLASAVEKYEASCKALGQPKDRQ